MRTADRTGDARVLRDVAAIGAAMFAVGASFGAVAVAAGLPVWATLAMSAVVYAGGAQFMAVGLVAAGSPFAAVLAGLLLNARHLPFGLALGGALGTRRAQRLLGSHLMTDEATAFALARPAGPQRRRAFWLAGVLLFLAWNAGTALGVLAGGAAGDPATLGLDAAFPAGLAALLLPSLRDRETRRVAVLGAGLAVLATPLLPAGLPVLLALAALVLPLLARRRPPASPAADPNPASADRSVVPSDPDAAPGGGPVAVPDAAGGGPVDDGGARRSARAGEVSC
ncbi:MULTISPECIES: AzlC family ABC transporter permease [unclassified Micromonospora]|uniref:AzlC family ABC transporter permease n=1 Tax=unclassified Micromonospora TaxID=2617518 RepID=UPI001E3C931A|nr:MULTISPECIES: AzlC family ABC transporter permease [unclassified Micromonospora]MCZ7476718.1 AzlC family ABC transporter permease [Micromonospora sp. WMMC273]WBC01537.1 AzlC family ABC transporter permease [Micromonospora sp. WMMA1976]